LPTPNYQFEKRKRDLDKKARKAAKMLRKKEASLARPADRAEGSPVAGGDSDTPVDAG
jgi:hypothetical protein